MHFRFYFYLILIGMSALPVFAGMNDDPNLVGWWTFDNATAQDWSVNSHDGQLHNGARVVYDSVRGMVLHNPSSGFPTSGAQLGDGSPPGGRSGHVYCGGERAPADANLTWADITKSFSVLCWVKTQTYWFPQWSGFPNRFEKQWQNIFTKGTFNGGQMMITTVGTSARVSFKCTGLGSGYDRIYGADTTIDDGLWHHIAA
ncbi:MAG: hypothetical protein ABFD79_15795, partial [Phycisphaerales bacterium]